MTTAYLAAATAAQVVVPTGKGDPTWFDNPAVNVLVWKKDSKKADAIAKLDKLLHSDQVKQYIEQTWSDGSVIPAF